MNVCEVADISGDIDLVDACNLDSVLVQKSESDVFVEVLHVHIPLVSIDELAHLLPLLSMEDRVSAQAKPLTTFAHDERESFIPHDGELSGIATELFRSSIRSEIDSTRNRLRLAVVIVVVSSQVLHDLLVLVRDRHRIVSIDAVGFEMVRKSSEKQLIEDTSLIKAEIIVGFVKSPVREVLWAIVYSIESIPADKRNSI